MRRPIPSKAMVIAGALALLLSARASAAAAVHTPATLEIREAATLSVANNPQLQLLLSSGSGTIFTVTANPVPPADAGGPVMPTVSGSGPWADSVASGEVLSVSLADASGEESGGAADAPQVRFIIAQFN